MLPPEAFFEAQVCTKCRRYLSIFPIKNYHDKSVKCGRCSTEDDNGVESQLTQMVLQNIKFPCDNRLAGCKEEARPYEMRDHLIQCDEHDYNCLICEKFTGIPLQLQHHCEREHADKKLKTSGFIIKGKSPEQFFFYRQEWIFAFVQVSNAFSTFYFQVAYCGHQYRGELLQELNLSIITKGDLQEEFYLGPKPCSSLHRVSDPDGRFRVTLKPDSKMFIVNFKLIEQPIVDLTSFTGSLTLYQPNTTVKYTFRHTFPNILNMETDKDYYIPINVYVLGHPLRVSVYMRDQMFQVYLEWGESKTKSPENCKVFAECYVSSKLGSKVDELLNTPLKVGTFLGLLEIHRNQLINVNDQGLVDVHVKVLVKLQLNPFKNENKKIKKIKFAL